MRLRSLAFLVLVLGVAIPAQDESRPNILFLLADDHRPDAVAAFGNEHIETPHIDSLVNRGFRFERTYCMGSIHGAVCQPSRAMIHSGRSLYRVRMNLADAPTLGEVLRSAGYRTFGTGKWHNGGASFLRSFEHGKNVMLGGMSNHLKVPIQDVQDNGKLSKRRIGDKFSSVLFADAAVEFLGDLDDSAEPFFAYVSFTAPHDPRQPPVPFREKYYDRRPPLPKNFMPQHPFHNGWMTGRDESLAPWPRTPEVVGDQLAEYYGLITHMDEQIGRVLAALEASGRAENTIVVFSADHGLAVGSHGLLGKQSVYEHAMGSPLVIAGPGIPHGSSPALTYLYDLMPTLLDAAGLAAPEGVVGHSLRPIWEGGSARVRDSLYLTYENKMRAVTDGRWKLIRYPPIDHEQLFDLATDPDELVDLVSSPDHQEHRARLRALMDEHHTAVADPHPLVVNKPRRNKKADLTGRKRKPDGSQPDWIKAKYFADQPAPRPHILFIMVDDLGPEWISACGGNFHTPNIDRIAEEGTRFRNVYSMPKCTPTRATLLTGQYPYRHGWVNHWDVPRWGAGCHFDPKHNPSWPQALKAVGYRAAIAGKWQLNDFRVQPEILAAHGFDEWCMWTGGEGGNPQSNERYHTPYVHDMSGSSLREGQFGPELYTNFLIDFMKRNAEQPMLLYYPMALTHTPLIATPLDPDARTKDQRHRAMVRYTDHLVGRLLDAIDDLDLAHEMLVIFTTDNGTARGIDGKLGGRPVKGGKGRMVEPGCRAPFFARWVGQVSPGRTVPALVDFTDIYPTMLELAGAEVHDGHHVDGVSFVDPLIGFGGKGHRKWMMAMGGRTAHLRNGRVVPELPYAPRVLRTAAYKLWIDAEGKPARLHHLPSDPDETTNLIDAPDGKAAAALALLTKVARKFPETDAHPRYDALPPQPWDKKPPKK